MGFLLRMKKFSAPDDLLGIDRDWYGKGGLSLLEERCELVYKNVFDLIRLFDLDADAHRVDARLDENSLVIVTGDGQGRQEYLGRGLGFDLGNIMSLGGLRCKIGERKSSCQAVTHTIQVWPQRDTLYCRLAIGSWGHNAVRR